MAGDDGDTLLNNWDNSYGDYVSDHGCATHNGVASIGQYDCNAFDGAIQCYGFANKVFYDIFGEHCPNLSRRTDISNISIGDHVRFSTWGNTGHSAIVIARSGDTLTLVEGNYGGQCMIKWGRTVSLSGSGIVGFYHASNWNQVYNDKGSFYLDVNGVLNGATSGSLQDFGTCDVYINGSRVADDVNDYYQEWPSGTTYEIKDIRPTSQHTYSGNNSYSGTIGTSTVNINLPFDTYGTLTVKGRLDDTVSSNIAGYGTFDVYINGSADGTGLTSYSKKWPKGTAFEVRNAKSLEDHLYEGTAVGSLYGTLGTGESTVTLSFITKGVPGADWTYTNRLPGNITPDYCDIQYQYTETTTAASSPGSGWVKQEGSGTTRYENDGGVYDSDFELSTSETRVYVGSYYYHYCGANTGVEVEHYNDGVHTDYHNAGDVSQFYVSKTYTDELDSRYQSYLIKWVSGQWADGLAYCSAGRSAIYYRRYQYQNKKAVTYYTWTKTSDWLTEPSGSGTPSRYRYRLRDTGAPVISSVEVTEITPTSYTITCTASDDSGVLKLSAKSWTDTETEANAKVNEAVPEVVDNEVEISVTIPAADHGNEKDVNYNTKITVYDKAGNTTEYTAGEIKVYIATLVRSSRKLELPADLEEIEEEAFEGSIAFGEVYIPDGTVRIGSRAFADCSRLVFISIPDSVTEIADDIFDGSSNAVVQCSIGSEAEAFAKRNGIPYFTDIQAD